MESLGITGVEALLLIGAVTGFVEWVKCIFNKDWKGVITILGAAMVGGLISLLPEINFDTLTGIVGGLAASGVITIGQNIGKTGTGAVIEKKK